MAAASRTPPKGRLMPVVIDQNARDEPDRPWASVPYDDNDLSRGYEDISFSSLANAINKLAWILDSTLGKATELHTIAYMGVVDLRYHMMQMAACKTGRVVLLPSHLNTLTVHLSLMEKLNCKALFSSTGFPVDDVLAARPMPHKVIPELNDLISLEDVAEWYPYTKTYEEAAATPYMYIHTSGTTGEPKPVPYSHAVLHGAVLQNALPDVNGRGRGLDYMFPGRGGRCILPVSPFHAISSQVGLQMSVLGDGVFVMPYRNRSMSMNDPIPEVLLQSRATHGFLVPYVMEAVARTPDPEKYIKNFKIISFGGGDLSVLAQKTWSKYTQIQNSWGATEIGGIPQLRSEKEDHEYLAFDIDNSGVEFREVKLDDYDNGENSPKVYEMVLVWRAHTAQFSGYYIRKATLSGTDPPYPEHRIGDLWIPHPDPKKARYVWKFAGRLDDVVCLATGINVHTGTIEKALMAHKLVKAALVVGNRHLQPLALIELVVPGEDPAVIQDIYESILMPLNANTQSHARIARTHILVVPQLGLVRTVKGTVSKLKSELKFQKEINEIYQKFGDTYHDKGLNGVYKD
ncbi:hypothetical protein GGS21DRAFT_267340 [Xylaria nigripes]|nr:hypothetical protein GGS21DRAFT_267340 [Xylaria nigripes]